jgi:hypothetical protein
MAQLGVPQAMGPVVLVVCLAMEVQVGFQVGLELLKQLEACQDTVVLAMAMEAVKVVMGLLLDMEGEAVVLVLPQVGMGVQQRQVQVVGVMVQDMVTSLLLDMEIMHGDQQEQTLTTVEEQEQQLQAVGTTAWGLEQQLMVLPMGLQFMGEGMVQQEGRHNELLMHALGLTQWLPTAQASYLYVRAAILNRVHA